MGFVNGYLNAESLNVWRTLVCFTTDSQWHGENSNNYVIDDSPLYRALPPCSQICPSNMWHFLCWSLALIRLSFLSWRWVRWAGSRGQTCGRCRWTAWSGWGLWVCPACGCGRWTSPRGWSPSGPWPTSACLHCARQLTKARRRNSRLDRKDFPDFLQKMRSFIVLIQLSGCCEVKAYIFEFQMLDKLSIDQCLLSLQQACCCIALEIFCLDFQTSFVLMCDSSFNIRNQESGCNLGRSRLNNILLCETHVHHFLAAVAVTIAMQFVCSSITIHNFASSGTRHWLKL